MYIKPEKAYSDTSRLCLDIKNTIIILKSNVFSFYERLCSTASVSTDSSHEPFAYVTFQTMPPSGQKLTIKPFKGGMSIPGLSNIDEHLSNSLVY